MHEACEAWERSHRTLEARELVAIYDQSWASHMSRLTRDEPDLDKWLTGTPRTRGGVDVERRHARGIEQVHAYTARALSEPWVIWETPDLEPAIELFFRLDLNGIEVIGYIDQVREWPSGLLEIVDLKSGTKVPAWDFQLGIYSLAMQETYGVEIGTGRFYMLKNDDYTNPTDLSFFTMERVTKWFDGLNRGIEAKSFLPNVGDHCRICPVWKYCSAK